MEYIVLLSFAAYAFYTAVQMIRGEYLNFKPFNCKLCLSYWFTLAYIIIFDFTIMNIILIPLAVSGIVYFIGLIEDRLTYYRE